MTSRSAQRQRRQRRVRKKISGTTNRPRLSVFRSNRHISAQIIDDENGRTVVAASTSEASIVVAEMVANQISDFLDKGIKKNTV